MTTTAQKTATTTLRANGATLLITATLKADGKAVTTVTTIDAEKKSTRGMSEVHESMDAAKAHMAKLAEKAMKAGWQKRQHAFQPKPDAFSTIPAPPKAQKAGAK